MVAPSRTAAGPERIPYLSQPCVRLVPELSLAALKQKCDKELAMWYCLRVINHWGSGYLPLQDAIGALGQVFGYSGSTIKRTLRKGEGLFWTQKDGKRGSIVEIYGLNRVSRGLNTYWLKCFYDIPVGSFDSLKRRRAWMYSVFFKPDGLKRAKPISRESITEATGVVRRQQQRYEVVTGIKKQENRAFKQNGDGYVPIEVEVEGKSRMINIQRQLGNSYACKVVRTARGMCKKTRDATKSFKEGEALAAPRFFFSPQKLVRARERADEAFLAIAYRNRRLPTRGEWCSV